MARIETCHELALVAPFVAADYAIAAVIDSTITRIDFTRRATLDRATRKRAPIATFVIAIDEFIAIAEFICVELAIATFLLRLELASAHVEVTIATALHRASILFAKIRAIPRLITFTKRIAIALFTILIDLTVATNRFCRDLASTVVNRTIFITCHFAIAINRAPPLTSVFVK